MTREHDLEQTLKRWLDDGADRAPERFVWAALDDVERTPQRGAQWALLEGFLMKLKPAAPIFGVAAVVVLAILAWQMFLSPNVGDADPSPTPRLFSEADLPTIVLTENNAPEGLTVDNTESGRGALLTPLRPGGEIFDLNAFADGLMTNLESTDTGGYVSWAALFETAADAEAAFDLIVDEHGSEEGWGMDRSAGDPGLGQESATFTGAAYDIFDTNIVHVWRAGNLVLAAVAVGELAEGEANADRLLSLAELMDDRTR